jgi:MFS family permease
LGLASFILTFLVAETASPAEPQQESAAGTPRTTPSEVSSTTPKTGFLWFPAKYWVMLVVLILFSLANSSDTFLLLHASDHGFSSWGVVMLYAVYNITYSALSYPAGALSDRLGRWQIMTVGWLLYAAVYAGFALLPATQAWGLWPLMALYGVYMALTEGVGKALIADHAPRESPNDS